MWSVFLCKLVSRRVRSDALVALHDFEDLQVAAVLLHNFLSVNQLVEFVVVVCSLPERLAIVDHTFQDSSPEEVLDKTVCSEKLKIKEYGCKSGRLIN